MSALYSRYGHLLGATYDDGNRDCYGLCRRFYAENYDIELPDYARSADFVYDGFNQVEQYLVEIDFKVVDVAPSRLEFGDALFFNVPNAQRYTQVNHLGVYVGNGLFIHHLFDKTAQEDPLTDAWKRRILAVARNDLVTAENRKWHAANAVDLLSLLPEHVKRQFGLGATTVLEPAVRESRGGIARPYDCGTEERKPDAESVLRGSTDGTGGVRRRRVRHVAHAPAEQRESVPGGSAVVLDAASVGSVHRDGEPRSTVRGQKRKGDAR